MEDLSAKLRILLRTEAVVLRLQWRRLSVQGALIGAALVLLALMTILLNLAAYIYLAERMSAHLAALTLGLVNGGLASVLLLLARRVGPGNEIQIAEELRDLAWKQLQSDTDQLGRSISGLRSNAEAFRSSLTTWAGSGPGLLQWAPLLPAALRTLKQLLRRR